MVNSHHKKKKKYCGWEYGKAVLVSEPHLFFDVSVVIFLTLDVSDLE